MRTAALTSERRSEIARNAALRRWRADLVTDEVTLTKPRCVVCRHLIGFDAEGGPACIPGYGWACIVCCRRLVRAELRRKAVPSLGQVLRENRQVAGRRG